MLRSLIQNSLFEQSEVFVFADGPKEDASEADIAKIGEVRKLFEPLNNNPHVILRFSEKNRGLTTSIVSGITEIINRYGKVIVVEDDLELSPGFLKYMNDALSLYENEERVMHVGGYMAPHSFATNETMFFRAPTIWGWGTWKRAWEFASFDAKELLKRIRKTVNAQHEFNVRDGYPYYRLLNEISMGKVNAWSISWYATIFLKRGFCLVPDKSLVRNIGFDNSGTNCEPTDIFSKQEIIESIDINKIKIIESEKCIKSFHDLWELQSIRVRHENEGIAKILETLSFSIKKTIRKLLVCVA